LLITCCWLFIPAYSLLITRYALRLTPYVLQVYAREEELMRARESVASLEEEQQRAAIDMLGLQVCS
jgi:hypothetical protein